MEHFEEWYKEYTTRVDSGIDYLDAQVGYKEALKFTLTITSAWRKCGIPTGVEDAINKELGDA